MGNFYTNFIIPGTNGEDVLSLVRDLGRQAYLIPDQAGTVVLYDADCDEQDVEEIARFGVKIADRLSLPVLACLNHDDDHLLLWVFRKGEEPSLYQSFLDAPRFAWTLSRVWGGVIAFPLIVAVLGWPIFIFQHLRHAVLARLLGLPNASVGYGFQYISNGEIPPDITEDAIIRA